MVRPSSGRAVNLGIFLQLNLPRTAGKSNTVTSRTLSTKVSCWSIRPYNYKSCPLGGVTPGFNSRANMKISSYLPAGNLNATRAGGNHPRAPCAIHSRDTAIRICSVPPLIRKNQFVKISALDKVMSRAEYFCRRITFDFWVQFCQSEAKCYRQNQYLGPTFVKTGV